MFFNRLVMEIKHCHREKNILFTVSTRKLNEESFRKEKKTKKTKDTLWPVDWAKNTIKENHVECPGSSVDSWTVSVEGISVFGATVSESFFECVSWFSSTPSDLVDAEGVGDGAVTGEFRCCSNENSVIKRFFNEWLLLAVGEAVVGGVFPVIEFVIIIGLTDGLFALGECSKWAAEIGCGSDGEDAR